MLKERRFKKAMELIGPMVGANRWHLTAQRIFLKDIISSPENELIEVRDCPDGVEPLMYAERLLNKGRRLVETGEDNLQTGLYGHLALRLYREYLIRVTEIGNGDVREYCRKARNAKTRADIPEWNETPGPKD